MGTATDGVGLGARRTGAACGCSTGVALAAGGTTMGGTATGGATGDEVARGVGVGVGVGAARRDSGTSGATGPCLSGEGVCAEDSGGRRKSRADGGAAASGGASATAAIRAKVGKRMSVTRGMAGRAE